MVTIATHNGSFHTDDVFAVAALEMYLAQEEGEESEVIRTRDEEVINEADYVLDVGGVYDPAAGRFDHHQEDSPDPRANGVPFAAFGLVWREYGVLLCGDEVVAQTIDERLVQTIDGPDNGVFLTGPATMQGVYPYFLQDAVNAFNPTWREDAELADERFGQVVEWAKVLLAREIANTKDFLAGEELAEAAYEAAEDKQLIYFDEKVPWKRVLAKKTEPMLVIFPDGKGNWRLQAVPDEDFGYSFAFPEAWRGKSDEALQAATGVSAAVFCHKSLPMLVTETKEAAETLAQELLAG